MLVTVLIFDMHTMKNYVSYQIISQTAYVSK